MWVKPKSLYTTFLHLVTTKKVKLWSEKVDDLFTLTYNLELC
jgi:hypothetical protein